MQNTNAQQNSIIVKVGTHGSTLKFNNTKSFRAITFAEAEKLHSKHTDSIIIVEQQHEDDYDGFRLFLDLLHEKGCSAKVCFFCEPEYKNSPAFRDFFEGLISNTYNIKYFSDSEKLRDTITNNSSSLEITLVSDTHDKRIDEIDDVSITFAAPAPAPVAGADSCAGDTNSELIITTNSNSNGSVSTVIEPLDRPYSSGDSASTIPQQVQHQNMVPIEDYYRLEDKLTHLESQISDYKKKCAELSNKSESYEVELHRLRDDKSKLEVQLTSCKDSIEEADNLRAQNRGLLNQINELQSSSSFTSSEYNILQDDNKKLLEKIESLQKEKADLEEISASLEERIKELTAEQYKIIEELDTLRNSHSDTLSDYETRINELASEKALLLEELRISNESKAEFERTATELAAENAEAVESNAVLQSKLDALLLQNAGDTERYKELDATINSLQLQSDADRQKISDLEVRERELIAENKQLTEKVEDAESASAITDAENDSLRDSIANLQRELGARNGELQGLQDMRDSLIDSNNSLNDKLKEASEIIGKLQSEKQAALQKLNTAEVEKSSLLSKMQVLSSGLDRIKGGANTPSVADMLAINNTSISDNYHIKPITYKRPSPQGTGVQGTKYFMFIGSGSYGTTTSAFSATQLLAQQQYKVLFVDFDLSNAKADSWFSRSPVIPTTNLPNVSHTSLNTGISLLYSKGIQYYKQNINCIIFPGPRQKGGRMDYISGLIEYADPAKVCSADYTGFIEAISRDYDFVIFDFGRLGISKLSDTLISTFSRFVDRTVLVTSSDDLDIRNSRIRINRSGVNMQSLVWLINLSQTTALSDRCRESIKPIRYTVMPFINGFYGTRTTFLQNSMGKDRYRMFFDSFVNSI